MSIIEMMILLTLRCCGMTDCLKTLRVILIVRLQNMAVTERNENDGWSNHPSCIVNRVVLRNMVDMVHLCHVKHTNNGA